MAVQSMRDAGKEDFETKARRAKLEQCVTDNSTCYYGFEANKVFDHPLGELEHELRKQGRPVKLFTSTAFNVNNETTTFLVEPKHGHSGNTGGTLERDKKMVFVDKSGVWRHNNNVSVSERYHRQTVKSISAGPFLADLAASSDFLAMKMDIEGFEYTILPHLLLTQPRALCAVDVMAIEWHERMVPKFAGASHHLGFMMRHADCGTTLLDWA